MENRMIAACGLVCTECPAFLATKAGDEKKIAETAELWAKEYGVDVTPENVWCDGCIVEGRKCGHCRVCEIRACAMNKKVPNCARCAEFESCATIQNFFKLAPHAEKTLRKIRSCDNC